MRKFAYSLVILITIFACKNKKSLSGEKAIDTPDFFDAFDKLKLPFTVADTSLKDVSDTNTISYPIFTQFVPDTIFNYPFGKDRKLTIHPIGKIEQKGKESYFATYVTSKTQSAVYLSVYDSSKHMATLPLVVGNTGDGSVNTATIDSKLSIVLNKEWLEKNEPFYTRLIYAYNNVGIFTTVLSETNAQQIGAAGILNPFDTFPKLYKYSGDYSRGNKKVVYIRDGKTPDTYLFFVHFENEDEDDPCDGELKGQFKMNSEKSGSFTGNGDPCVLDFNFTGNQVQVKETGSCGNYRGIRCFFNDTYTKKKEPKTVTKKKPTATQKR